ncbi:hypothetical protein BBJ28_00020674 [Nothophytophthora sp. Chile5]|nr:hypothetical protein BBJ28_00020674 [Nothophytophthora sp. Chile5]
MGGGGERLHSTVRLNQFSLQFEDRALEAAYQAGLHTRKKALWLRSLVPAAASHLLFALADGLDHPVENLLVTLPARVFLADLMQAKERTMLLVSVSNGIPTLLLYALQRTSLHQWDALFVTFGLSFYTIPKITPLGYVSSFYGSWATAAVYAMLAFVVRPPTRLAESVLGISFLVPMVWVFNTISYYSEYNSRERFALRRRLRRESITLAVACTSGGHQAVSTGGEVDGDWLPRVLSLRGLMAASTNRTASFIIAVVLWGAFTLGGWTSLPDTFKFVDEDTGWAWFSHCAGVTVFLLVMTRRLRWLLVVPAGGALVLWVMSLAMPASWIIVSAHSVGYGLLLASVVIAMGVFGWFVCAWRELVSFLTRSCFLYPQLQAGMETEYPLLVRIVSEYTAGFDPEILSARVPTATAIEAMGTQATTASGSRLMGSPRRRRSVEETVTKTSPVETQQKGVSKNVSHKKNGVGETASSSAAPRVVSPTASVGVDTANAKTIASVPKESEATCSSDHSDRKMVSVLPSFKPGKCFFCSKNDAEHFVPACGMWGKWTHWRMNQQHGLNSVSTSSIASSSSAGSGPSSSKGAVVVSMCTSYYDLQNDKSQLESRLQEEKDTTAGLTKQLGSSQNQEQRLAMENVQLKAEIHALEEKHTTELRRREEQLQAKMELVQKEANRATHQRKLEVKKSETAHAVSLQKRLETSERLTQKSQARAKNAEAEAAALRASLKQSEKEVDDWKSQVAALRSRRLSSGDHRHQQPEQQDRSSPLSAPSVLDFSFISTASGSSSVDSSPLSGLQTLQPTGRLPYAQSLEIEGLRESSRHSQEDVAFSERWRFLRAADLDEDDAS